MVLMVDRQDAYIRLEGLRTIMRLGVRVSGEGGIDVSKTASSVLTHDAEPYGKVLSRYQPAGILGSMARRARVAKGSEAFAPASARSPLFAGQLPKPPIESALAAYHHFSLDHH